MQVESLAVRLRPRPMPEAADLGVLLARRHWRSIWAVFTPVYLVVAVLALASIEISVWMPSLVIFCAKPWLDRTLLFVLSRVAKLSVERTTMAILPWLVPLFAALIAITFIPELTLWLPRTMGMIR